jgi:hypothetical protein
MFMVGHRGLEPRKALALNEVAVPICISQRPTLTRLEVYLRAGTGAGSQPVLTTFDTSQTALAHLA